MYAVIKTGGKQYKVAPGDVIQVEKLAVDAGSQFDITDVLMVSNGEDIRVGSPFVDGGSVTAEVTSHGRGKKIRIIKMRRRKHYRKQMGHRQSYTELKITRIVANGIEGVVPVDASLATKSETVEAASTDAALAEA